MKQQWRRHTQGFSLVELSIVIGVVGVILGGIWSLTNLMNLRVKQERLHEQLYTIVGNIRGAYAGQSGLPSTSPTVMMVNLTGLGVFPSDMVHSVAGPLSVVDSPFGEQVNPNSPGSKYNSLYACGWKGTGSTKCDFAGAASNVPLFAIEVLLRGMGPCVGAVLKNSSPATIPGLVDVSINGYTVVATNNKPLPVAFPIASTNCKATVNVVDFVYRLTPS